MKRPRAQRGLTIFYLTDSGRRVAEALSEGFGGTELIRGHLDRLPEMWRDREALIFVMAAGIVVRLVAPLVRDKALDPAVVVVDEKGEFAVALLSGHIGGANELAKAAAGITGGTSVITTSSDVNGFPALDLMAMDLGLVIEDSKSLTEAMVAFLSGEGLSIYSDFNLGHWQAEFERAGAEVLPEGDYWSFADASQAQESDRCARKKSVLVTEKSIDGTGATVLRPRCLWFGVGCRKGVAKEEVLDAVDMAAKKAGVSTLSLAGMATIDNKAAESGLIEAAMELGARLKLYAAKELESAVAKMKNGRAMPSLSRFVKDTVGVGSVCEAASILASGMGSRVLPKSTFGRVTVAIAKANWRSSA